MAKPNFKTNQTVARDVLSKGGASKSGPLSRDRAETDRRRAAAEAPEQGGKINAKKDGRGRPKGEPTVNILLSLPETWLVWLDAEMDRRHMTSRPMTIRAVIAEAMKL